MIIFRTETFENDQKMKVTHRIVVANPKNLPMPEWFSPFCGHFTATVNTPFGEQPTPISMRIPADTLEEAFANFMATAKEAVDELKENLAAEAKAAQDAANGIVTPKKGLILPT